MKLLIDYYVSAVERLAQDFSKMMSRKFVIYCDDKHIYAKFMQPQQFLITIPNYNGCLCALIAILTSHQLMYCMIIVFMVQS